jgi:hypothetical protein
MQQHNIEWLRHMTTKRNNQQLGAINQSLDTELQASVNTWQDPTQPAYTGTTESVNPFPV